MTDMQDIRAKLEAMAAKQAAHMADMQREMAELSGITTAEQMAKYQALMVNWSEANERSRQIQQEMGQALKDIIQKM